MEAAHAKDTKERLGGVERLHEAPLLAHLPHGASPGSVQPPVATSSTRTDGSSLRRSSLPLAAALLLSASAPARCGSIPYCASMVFLAIGKLVLGLVFGNSFVMILGQFPIGILGVMLLFSGIELAMASRDMGSKEESFVMLAAPVCRSRARAPRSFSSRGLCCTCCCTSGRWTTEGFSVDGARGGGNRRTRLGKTVLEMLDENITNCC